MNVVVCICSAGRRALLRDCMASFQHLAVPDGWSLRIVVVDNDAAPECEETIADIVAALPFRVRCIHEPQPGISHARNRALDTALEGDPDFLAFIDDDETIDPGWLAAMSAAHADYGADVYKGPVYRRFPEGRSVWMEQQSMRHNNRPTGLPIERVGGGNVMFSAALLARNSMGLRFDEIFSSIGGEDTDFFNRAHNLGASMIWVRDAIATESVPMRRQTFGYQVKRAFRNGCNEAIREVVRKPAIRTYTSVIATGAQDIARGSFQLIILPASALFAKSTAPQKLLKAARIISKGSGRVMGLLGYRVQAYADPARS